MNHWPFLSMIVVNSFTIQGRGLLVRVRKAILVHPSWFGRRLVFIVARGTGPCCSTQAARDPVQLAWMVNQAVG
jgi:hypothetical protein